MPEGGNPPSGKGPSRTTWTSVLKTVVPVLSRNNDSNLIIHSAGNKRRSRVCTAVCTQAK
eukprot:scaffold291014_cov31-Attheya_sp.AAC.1